MQRHIKHSYLNALSWLRQWTLRSKTNNNANFWLAQLTIRSRQFDSVCQKKCANSRTYLFDLCVERSDDGLLLFNDVRHALASRDHLAHALCHVHQHNAVLVLTACTHNNERTLKPWKQYCQILVTKSNTCVHGTCTCTHKGVNTYILVFRIRTKLHWRQVHVKNCYWILHQSAVVTGVQMKSAGGDFIVMRSSSCEQNHILHAAIRTGRLFVCSAWRSLQLTSDIACPVPRTYRPG